jgi:hypothetical protein
MEFFILLFILGALCHTQSSCPDPSPDPPGEDEE